MINEVLPLGCRVRGEHDRAVPFTNLPCIEYESLPCVTDVYREYFPWNALVAVFGPNQSVFRDPTLAAACQMAAERSATVLVVDPRSPVDPSVLWRTAGHRVFGIGGIGPYVDELERLEASGVRLSAPMWLGYADGLPRTTLPDGSLGGVIDHGTSFFVAMAGHPMNESEQETAMIGHLEEYRRILTPGGVLFLHLPDAMNHKGLPGVLGRHLQVTGWGVLDVMVRDTCELVVSEDENTLRDREEAKRAGLLRYFNHYIRTPQGAIVRIAAATSFESSHLYVCVRLD